ncbi:hypothetical protein [Bernardetia sp.]|uniref:hypothetical protein n=1 Tax=Bernardetia sp. TaxID=1937974 RepID=UPI0025C1317D|nr:hypothetical protein [Bernardetia sp.]
MTEKYKYSEKDIKILTLDESMRQRPQMYFGKLTNRGFIYNLKVILQDVYELSQANLISIELIETHSVKIRFENFKRSIEKKWIDYQGLELYKIPSNYLFLFELQAFKALSTDFIIRSKDFKQVYKDGKLIKNTETTDLIDGWLEVEFTLDRQFWKDFEFNTDYIHQEIRDFAFLNKNIKFKLNYFTDNEENKITYHFKNGLKDKVNNELLNGHGGSDLQMEVELKQEQFELEAAFAFREYDIDEPILKSYVNKAYTPEDGTHVEAVLKGITYGIMAYLQKHELTGNHRISEQSVRKNIILFLNVQFFNIDMQMFKYRTKYKLDNVGIIEPISTHISKLVFEKLESDKEIAEKIIKKFRIYE